MDSFAANATEHFTILEPQNTEIDGLSVLRKCQTTDLKALKWCHVQSGNPLWLHSPLVSAMRIFFLFLRADFFVVNFHALGDESRCVLYLRLFIFIMVTLRKTKLQMREDGNNGKSKKKSVK